MPPMRESAAWRHARRRTGRPLVIFGVDRRQHAARRPRRRHGAVHRVGRPVGHDGPDGLRQPRPRRLRHARRLRHRAGDAALGHRLRAGAGARLRRHRRRSAWCFERLLYSRLYRATELDQVLFTIGLVFVMIASVTLVVGPETQPLMLPSWLQGPDRPRLHPLSHLQHLPDRRRHRDRARAVARLRAHPHRRADPRRGRQPAHGGIARHQRRPPVHAHLRLRQRHGGAGRRPRRRIPRPRSAVSAAATSSTS